MFLLASTSVFGEAPRRFALVVGTGYGAPDQVVLQHADEDAEKMALVLRELGGVRSGDMEVLTEDVTVDRVIAALDRIEQAAANERARGNEAILMFYYSGHATINHLEIAGRRLSIADLRTRLRSNTATVRLAILDACHSGGIVRKKGGNRIHETHVSFAVDQQLQTEGYAILTSSAASEQSQESDALLGSFFTHFLVSGLRGAADMDADQRVTLVEAFRYAYTRTLRQTATKTAVAQHPHVELALKGSPDLVVTGLEQAQATVSVEIGSGTRWIIFDPDEKRVLAELEEGKRRMSVAIPAGKFAVYRHGEAGVARGVLDTRRTRNVLLRKENVRSVTLASYLRKGEAGVRLAALVGVQSFLNTGIRQQYVGPSPVFSAELTAQGLLGDALDLVVDTGFTHQSQRLKLENDDYSQLLTFFQAGIGLPYRLDFGTFSASVGPRFAYVYMRRRVYLDDEETTQQVSTVASGLSLGLTWRFTRLWSLGLRARVSYIRLPTDTGGQHGVFSEGHFVSGFHF